MMSGLGLLDTNNMDHLNPSNVYNTPYQHNYSNNNYSNRYNAGSSYNNMQNQGPPRFTSPKSIMEADLAKKMIMAI